MTTGRKFLSLDEFKRAAKAGTVPVDAGIYKDVDSAVVRAAEGADAGPISFIMSTATVDRMDDTIAVEGWKLENYRKNPVWLFGHNQWAFPVGKSLREYVQEQSLRSDVEFQARDVHEDGWRVGEMVRRGFLNACSVGFRPLKYAINEERGGGWMPACDFIEQELLECSVVPVPANPEALVAAKALDLAGPVREWAERVLGAEASAAALKAHSEAMWKTLRSTTVQVPGTKADDAAPTCAKCSRGMHDAWKFCPMCGEPAAKDDDDDDVDDTATDTTDDTDDDAKALAALKTAAAEFATTLAKPT